MIANHKVEIITGCKQVNALPETGGAAGGFPLKKGTWEVMRKEV